ncbi:MAG: hypothetical protein WBO54_00930 [Thermoanaerobaculia bacterium]
MRPLRMNGTRIAKSIVRSSWNQLGGIFVAGQVLFQGGDSALEVSLDLLRDLGIHAH